MHAQAALGTAMLMMRSDQAHDQRDTLDPSSESLAILDAAMEGAKMMRLERHAEMIEETKKGQSPMQ